MIDFEQLARNMKGDVMTDSLHQMIYATDASAYREMPLAVVYPRDASDVKECIKFARKNGITLIPRAAGTSLAGQVVGNGVVVDVSRYMNHVLEINEKEHWVRVEPGVVLDELNMRVKSLGLFFGPETSTSNRCCLGGMVGNNSCGSHSLVYGSTRDHLLEAKVILSDGEEAWLKGMNKDEVRDKMTEDTLEGKIYRCSVEMLENNREEIIQHFPDPALRRRNSGYAIDHLPLEKRARQIAHSYKIKFSRYLSPDQIKQIIDLTPEDNRFVRQVTRESGEKMFLRQLSRYAYTPLPWKTSCQLSWAANS